MATAIVQGVLASIGYAISGLPHAIAWGLCTAVASFFPVVGTALVWVPVSLYYASRGEISHAAMQEGQPLLILVAALGGIQVFGLAGIVVGPVMMSLFLAILTIYEREMDSAERSDTEPLFPRESQPSTEEVSSSGLRPSPEEG